MKLLISLRNVYKTRIQSTFMHIYNSNSGIEGEIGSELFYNLIEVVMEFFSLDGSVYEQSTRVRFRQTVGLRRVTCVDGDNHDVFFVLLLSITVDDYTTIITNKLQFCSSLVNRFYFARHIER